MTIEGLAVRIGPVAKDGAGIPALAVVTVGLSNRVAAGRGARARFGGPASELGWSIAQAARRALHAGIRGWQERTG